MDCSLLKLWFQHLGPGRVPKKKQTAKKSFQIGEEEFGSRAKGAGPPLEPVSILKCCCAAGALATQLHADGSSQGGGIRFLVRLGFDILYYLTLKKYCTI